MAAATLTVTGNVATKIAREIKKDTGEPWCHFRLACNERRYDNRTGTWADGEPSFYTVVCWQPQLARNVDSSLKKGEPVIVHGKVKVREWRDTFNVHRYTTEITATSIGHDLFRGVSAFRRPPRTSQTSQDSAEVKEKLQSYAIIDEHGVDRVTGEIPSPPERAGGADWSAIEAGEAAGSSGVPDAPGDLAAGPAGEPDQADAHSRGDIDADDAGELAEAGAVG